MSTTTHSALGGIATAALLCLLADAAMAQGQADFSAPLGRGYNILLGALRVIFAMIFAAGFLLFAFGKFHWAGGATMAAGAIGAVKSQAIADVFMGMA